MSNMLRPQKGLSLPNGLAQKREQERLEALIPLAIEAEEKTKEEFQAFLEKHNIFFEVHLDYRESQNGKRPVGQGITFISRLRLPQQPTQIQ